MKTHLTLAFALLLLSTGAALASTPDGKPPSEETVCDNETGAAFGLCNAYCEAMDCDSNNPQASANACSKVRTKFQNITGRDLPCEAPACPCNNPAVNQLFADTVAGLTTITSCTQHFGGAVVEAAGSNVGSIPFGVAWTCGEGFPFGVQITAEQGAVCAQLLQAAAAAQNVPCP